ncbi:hypothetical protein, partial [Micromonospora sp. NPDC047740]|uniref:hypothetical protein n=1 Tax=Micromonospora sp. NPDC047740 TaxID=3364254 RepID=UPI003715155E
DPPTPPPSPRHEQPLRPTSPYRAVITIPGWSIRPGGVVPQNWQLAIAAWCLSTLLAVVGIAVSVSNQSQVAWLRALSIVLGVIAVTFFVAALGRTLSLVRRLPLGSRDSVDMRIGIHSSRWAQSPRDVADAYEFFASLLPRDPPSLALIQGLYRRNPMCIRLIESERNNKRFLVGMVVIAPLSARAVRDFQEKAFTSLDSGMLERYVTRRWQRPRGIYLGGVAGTTSAGRAWALSFLESFLLASGAKALFARPASPDGLRVLKSAGFVPLGEPSPFWHREL